jgi:hypothetical protein
LRRNRFVRGGDGVEASQQPKPFRRLRYLAKGTRHEMIVAGAVGVGDLDRRGGEKLGLRRFDLAEALEMSRNLRAFDVVRTQVDAGDSGQDIGEGRDETRVFGRQTFEVATEFDEARRLGVPSGRIRAEAVESMGFRPLAARSQPR